MIIRCQYDKLVPIKELKAKFHPKNRNKHPQEQINRLIKILKYQGTRSPARISKRSGLMTAGHGRVLAAEKAGWTSYPVNFQEYENEDMEIADLTADNAIASWSELDLAGINLDVGDLGPNFDIDLLGIRDFKIDVSEKVDSESQANDGNSQDLPEDKIPDKIEPRVKPGEVYTIEGHTLYNGDCLKILESLQSDSLDALVTDPPAGISFMGKEWDDDKGGSKEWIKWMREVMKEALRVLKPGAHGLVWAIPRTSHWTAVALEDAGFEIRDVITHIFGSGFPKSHNIEKATGDSRFKGWGTALKPASEHWILIRKPCSEDTVAENVLKYGTGGINIDASRISLNGAKNPSIARREGPTRLKEMPSGWKIGGDGKAFNEPHPGESIGRFPANLVLSHNPDCVDVGTKKAKGSNPVKPGGGIADKTYGVSNSVYSPLDNKQVFDYTNEDGTETVAAWECSEGCAVKMLDEQSGSLKSGDPGIRRKQHETASMSVRLNMTGKKECGFGDIGGASRFFYCAKSSSSEKNEGIDKGNNLHPTVKSTKLMSYLIKMITPTDGTLLDCFGGSGTTMIAAHMNQFKSVLIEQSTEYCDIILARAEHITEKSAVLNG